MNRLKVSLVFIVVLISFTVFCQQNEWNKKAAFGGLKRERAVSFSIDNFGYIATGEDTVNMTHNDLWRYDPTLDVWTQMADLPGSTRRNAIGFAIEGLGYVGTGMDSSESALGIELKDFWAYDPLSNSWTQKADYPGAAGLGVYYAGAFTADNKGYVTCGKYGPSQYAFDLWEYKPATDTWAQRANFPGGIRYAVSALSINNKGYVGMGIDYDVYRKDWWEYDPSTNIWEQKSNLPGTERAASSTFTLGSKGFVVFGGDGGFKDELWEYNPYTDSWNIRANFPGGERRNGIAFSIGNKGYAGIGKGPSGIRQNFYEYSPLLPLDIEEDISLNISLFPNPCQGSTNLFLENESNASWYLIFDINGNIVEQHIIDSQTMKINCEFLSKGNYQLLILDNGYNVLASTTLITN